MKPRRSAFLFPAVMLFFFSCFIGYVPALNAKIIDRIVAVVNDNVITLSELESRAQPVLARFEQQRKRPLNAKEKEEILAQLLPQLIDEYLVDAEIKRLGIRIGDKEVDQALEQLCRSNHITLKELKAQLAAEGITLEQYKDQLKRQIQRTELINAQVKSKIVVTDEQIAEYLKQDASSSGKSKGGKSYILQHICIVPLNPDDPTSVKEAESIAKEAYKALEQGKPFEQVVAAYSAPAFRQNGGYLGGFREQEMAPFIKNAVLDLSPGEYSKIVKTPLGFQIFKVKAIRTGQDDELAVSGFEKERAREQIYQQEVNARFDEWLREIRSKATIKILF